MQLAKGATALTETWDASIYSRNHCMLGHAEEWFYTGLAGIKWNPAVPGFRRIVIAPQRDSMRLGPACCTLRYQFG